MKAHLLVAICAVAGCVVVHDEGTYSSGGGADKVSICHKGKKTIVVARAAVDAHLNHGDTMGACSG